MITKLIFLHFLFIFFTFTSSSPSTPPSNFTLFGTTTFNHTSIILTQHYNNCISSNTPDSNIGRVFYKHPIRFLDSNKSTDSFFTRFTFTVVPPPPPCLSGDGITFVITSDPNSLPHSDGCIGLPKSIDQKTLDSSFLAVEFDTNFDQGFGDINDNHVAIDVDSIVSVASVDLNRINLKSGKQITAWIEYRHTQNAILVWVGYNPKSPELILVYPGIDLSKRLNGSFYVGFTAANGRGSSIHMIDSWHFKTSKIRSPIVHEAFWSENCLICFPGDLVGEEGEIIESWQFISVLVLSLELLGALLLVMVLLVLVPYLVQFYSLRRNRRVREIRIRRRNRWMMMP